MEMSADRMLGIFGVLGIVIGVGVAIAMDPKIRSEMLFAIGCFIFSGVALSLTVGIWAFGTDFSAMKRVLVAGPLFVIICVSMVEASRWADGRYHRATAETDKKGKSTDSNSAQPLQAVEGGTTAPKKPEAPLSGPGSQPPLEIRSPLAGKPSGPEQQRTKPSKRQEGQAFHEKVPEMVYFSLGENGMTMGGSLKSFTEEKSTLINMGGFVPVKFHLEKGVIYCDVTIWGGPTGPPIQLVRNEFTIQPPNWDRNFSDNALEVVDNRGEPIFQLIRKTPSHYVMNGLMPIPGGGFILATPNEARGMPPSATMPPGTLKPIFKYPSWKYPGQYVE